ncbi:MAG: SDR family NAD(P)-dependent oxidoreductase, partial [Rhabdaerophilum sp.]
MDLGLTGKNALVLGAGGGLGRAIALSLAREGASVALAGRRIEPLDELAREIRSGGTRAIPVIWDFSDLDAIERVASTVE